MDAFRTGLVIVAVLGLPVSAAVAAPLDAPKCSLPTPAQAEQGCVLMLPSNGNVLLDKINGNVLASGAGGFTPVTKPTYLKVGDTILVKPDGRATLGTDPSCQSVIGPNVSVVITQVDNGWACAKVTGEKVVTGEHAGVLGAVVVGAGAGAAAWILLEHPAPSVSAE
jgi:hypothetical protein